MSLQGKVALVTGASRGIGQAIALELGRLGAVVIGTATSASGAEKIDQPMTVIRPEPGNDSTQRAPSNRDGVK